MDGRPGSGTDPVVVWWCAVAGDGRGRAATLLAAAAGDLLGVPAAEVTVRRGAGAGPVLGGAAEGLYAGLSHTHGVLAVALSRAGPVGVDVEALRAVPAAAVEPLARRWCTAGEADWIAGQPLPRRLRCLLMLWTGKEAMGKALGTGLRGGGLARAVPPGALHGDGSRLVAGPDRVAVALPPAPDGHVLAVAGAVPGAEVLVRRVRR